MTVVNPNDASHDIKLIPRYYPTGALTFETFDEATQESLIISNSYVIANGVLTLTFTSTFTEDQNLQFKLSEVAEVVFRGKLFATTQTPQDYKQTNGLYTHG
jgi:hypothetical protein